MFGQQGLRAGEEMLLEANVATHFEERQELTACPVRVEVSDFLLDATYFRQVDRLTRLWWALIMAV